MFIFKKHFLPQPSSLPLSLIITHLFFLYNLIRNCLSIHTSSRSRFLFQCIYLFFRMYNKVINIFPLKRHRITITSSYATSINDLDYDTLVEIISRVTPVKHMVTCKSVSKLWHTLISTICIPRIISCPVQSIIFATCTPSPLKRNPFLFASLSSPNHIEQLPLDGILPFQPSPIDFLDCCNGFFLFVNPSSEQYYIYNPSMEQTVAIPSPPQKNSPLNATLIFYPRYKVVHIPRAPFTMSIFSPETREWVLHSLDLDPTILESSWVFRSIFFSGSLYKLAASGHMLKFDIDHIGVRAIELPKIVIRKHPIGCLGVSQGSLHYAWDDDKLQMLVWRLDEGDLTEEWVLKHIIYHQYFIKHPLCSGFSDSSFFSVYAFHPTSDLLFVGNLSGIYSFDPSGKRLENICRLQSGTIIYSGPYLVFLFSPNLTSLDSFSQSINSNHLVSTYRL